MNPLDWINARLAAFLELPEKWAAWYEEARQIFEAEARYRTARGSYVQTDRELAAIQVMVELDQMQREHDGIRSKLVLERRESMGAVPIAFIVVAIRAVTAVLIVWAIAGLLKKSGAMESIVRELRAAGATPEQIIQAMQLAEDEKNALETVVGGIGATAKLLLVGAALVLLGPAIMTRMQRGRT